MTGADQQQTINSWFEFLMVFLAGLATYSSTMSCKLSFVRTLHKSVGLHWTTSQKTRTTTEIVSSRPPLIWCLSRDQYSHITHDHTQSTLRCAWFGVAVEQSGSKYFSRLLAFHYLWITLHRTASIELLSRFVFHCSDVPCILFKVVVAVNFSLLQNVTINFSLLVLLQNMYKSCGRVNFRALYPLYALHCCFGECSPLTRPVYRWLRRSEFPVLFRSWLFRTPIDFDFGSSIHAKW